jgi:hypothetical protein
MPRKCLVVLLFICTLRGLAQNATPESDHGSINGTVVDVNGGIVPGATVVLRCQSPCNGESTTANATGDFQLSGLSIGIPYVVGVSVSGFKDWTSGPTILTSDRSAVSLINLQLQMSQAAASVTVFASREELATEQVHLEEQQRVLGIIPNFYVVYDSKNAVPLTTKLKFLLAIRESTDSITIAGVGLLAGVQQAGGTPNYVEGAKGYGQRFGADTATGFSDILVGGAVLPSLLHQDPRYFYQGTGTTSSRLKHALFSAFICRGDDGRSQINFSSLGGELASSALAETYYPSPNRGPRLVFGGFAIGTGELALSAVIQEFLLRRLTPSVRRRDYEQ